jgi:hypothetical protein
LVKLKTQLSPATLADELGLELSGIESLSRWMLRGMLALPLT